MEKQIVTDEAIEARAEDLGADPSRFAAFVRWLEDNGNEVDPEDIDVTSWKSEEFEWGRSSYLVLTDSEADDAAEEYISESVWAFRAEFLIEYTGLPWEAVEMIKGFQESKCESANDTIKSMIKDWDGFVKDAISADGRGHFLSSWDGEQREIKHNDEWWYIYQN